VEDALRSHQAVAAAAVFGVPAGLQEDEVVAVVVLGEGKTADETTLKEWAATRLAPFKVPGRIYFRDALPMTATHRVARDVLRKEYANDASTN
jgi:acyl-coenzyme A synthetase/AMP-(fatty) acid ligase